MAGARKRGPLERLDLWGVNTASSIDLTRFRTLQENRAAAAANSAAGEGQQHEPAAKKPKLHLMGMRRSGKTSIAKVVFHRENAGDTLYLESTAKLVKEAKNSFVDFDVWDYPAALDVNDPESSPKTILSSPGAIIWVIDAQDEYFEPIDRLVATIVSFASAMGQDPNQTVNGAPPIRLPSHLTLEVFIHKIDGLSDDFKGDIYRDIQQRILEEFTDAGLEDIGTTCSFHQTSIYDHSIFEALSKVVQKLIPARTQATMESLVNSLCSNCRVEKAYLFDTQFKIYVASDTSPGDMRSFETCSEYLDVVRDLCQLYGWREPEVGEAQDGEETYEDYDVDGLVTMEKKGSRYLHMKSMNKFLTLVCIMGEGDPAEKQPLIDYNVRVFQRALVQVLER